MLYFLGVVFHSGVSERNGRLMFDISMGKAILSIVQVVLSVGLILIVLFQSGKRSGLSGAIAGAADTFLSKNQARTLDARLARITKWVAILFITLTLVMLLIR
ncbi:MAG: preprotein translocase subunit SecG [Oscillospiraceae bacterium]|nr:preprotein translocase subunit SecG [Oscillospiraceae bacterium]